MGPAYRLVTPRLVLRCLAPADAVDVRDLIVRSRAHVGPWVPLPPEEEGLEGMILRLRFLRAAFDSDRDLTYAVILRQSGELIGIGNLDTTALPHTREVGGWLRPDVSPAGLGIEAAAAMTRAGFEVLGMDNLQIRGEPENLPVAKLARSLGFLSDGVAHPRQWAEGVERNQIFWTLARAEYAGSAAAAVPVQAFDAIDRRVL